MGACYEFAIADLDQVLNFVESAADIAGFLGHEVNGDRATRSAALVGGRPVPGQAVVVMNLAFSHRASTNFDRMALECIRKRIECLDLAAKYGVRKPTAPALQPWGLTISYVVDPSGVLWHFAQNRN